MRKMPAESNDTTQLKELVKEVLLELLEERKDLFQELIVEAIEDIGLANAMEESETTDLVSREEVFQTLEEDDAFEKEAAMLGESDRFMSLLKARARKRQRCLSMISKRGRVTIIATMFVICWPDTSSKGQKKMSLKPRPSSIPRTIIINW